jgi:hypothetical protein
MSDWKSGSPRVKAGPDLARSVYADRDWRKGSLRDEYAEWLRSDENGFGKTTLQGGGTTTSV